MELKLNNISKKYNDIKVLDQISLIFNTNQFVIIKGESGSGKTTLLNIIAGLDNNFEGDIILDKKLIKKQNKFQTQYRKSNVSIIFQNYNLINYLTVLDNVLLPTLSARSKNINYAYELLNDLGLNKKTNRKPTSLSGGEQQKLAIARSLITDKPMIICDEPTGALDSKNSIDIMKLLKKISSDKLVLVVTHSNEYDYLADRIVKLSDGKIVNDNTIVSANNNIYIKDNCAKVSWLKLLKLAFKSIKSKIFKNIFISFAISIGIMAIVLMLTISNSVSLWINELLESYTNPLVVEVNKRDKDYENFTSDEIEKLMAIEKVDSIEKNSIIFSLNNKITDEEIIDLDIIRTISPHQKINLIKGRLPKKNEILINERISKHYNLDDKVQLDLIINDEYVVGEYSISGIITDDLLTIDYNTIFINYNDLNEIYLIEPNIIYLILGNKGDVKDVENIIKEMGYNTSYNIEAVSLFNEIINTITYVLIAISIVSLLVASIMTFTIFYISVIERTKEIGILKSIGFTNKNIRTLFIYESIILGLLSGLSATIKSYILIIISNRIIYNLLGFSLITIDLKYFLLGLIISILLCIISCIIPAIKASKTNIVEALRYY